MRLYRRVVSRCRRWRLLRIQVIELGACDFVVEGGRLRSFAQEAVIVFKSLGSFWQSSEDGIEAPVSRQVLILRWIGIVALCWWDGRKKTTRLNWTEFPKMTLLYEIASPTRFKTRTSRPRAYTVLQVTDQLRISFHFKLLILLFLSNTLHNGRLLWRSIPMARTLEARLARCFHRDGRPR